MFYDFYLQDQRIGELDLASPWQEGSQYPIPYQGEIRSFVVEKLIRMGKRVRADVRLLPKEMAG